MNAAPTSLVSWARQALALADADLQVTTVAGDASARRYFRLVQGDHAWMLADSPPESQKNSEFLAIRDILQKAQIRVPDLIAADLEQGFLLLEDFGDELLLSRLNEGSADAQYSPALVILQQLSAISTEALPVAAYDRALLTEELGRFGEWFVEAMLGHRLSASERALIAAFDEALIASALEQPRVLVHRDFHSRNLMLLANGSLGVIDFQDAVIGPVTYDLVSLCKDCYICWPRDRVEAWALAHWQWLTEAGRLPGVSAPAFLQWFDWMGLQRHTKVLGTFARLHLRDGKSGYLDDLPMVLAYVRETLAHYSGREESFAAFHQWFESILNPLIAQQPWSEAP